MKLQLDTKDKTVKVEGDITLKDLTEGLEKLLPNGLWKGYKLLTETVINNWNYPIVVPQYNPPHYFPSPIWVTNTAQEKNTVLCQGTFNIEI